MNTAKALTGRVAVAAGATRGAGRGIACALGGAGARVYCTGRNSCAAFAGRRRSRHLEVEFSLSRGLTVNEDTWGEGGWGKRFLVELLLWLIWKS